MFKTFTLSLLALSLLAGPTLAKTKCHTKVVHGTCTTLIFGLKNSDKSNQNSNIFDNVKASPIITDSTPPTHYNYPSSHYEPSDLGRNMYNGGTFHSYSPNGSYLSNLKSQPSNP